MKKLWYVWLWVMSSMMILSVVTAPIGYQYLSTHGPEWLRPAGNGMSPLWWSTILYILATGSMAVWYSIRAVIASVDVRASDKIKKLTHEVGMLEARRDRLAKQYEEDERLFSESKARRDRG